MTATGAGQVQVPAPVAAGIRSAVTRGAVGFLVAGVLLFGVTVTLLLTAPGGAGFLGSIALGGGANGGLLVMLAGFMLLDARRVVSGQTFLAGRAQRVQRSLLLLFVLSVVLSGICAYGIVRVADEEPIAGLLTLPLTSCPLTALAVVVSRSVLRPPRGPWLSHQWGTGTRRWVHTGFGPVTPAASLPSPEATEHSCGHAQLTGKRAPAVPSTLSR